MDLNERYSKVAHAMAIELVKSKTDPNELGKIYSYLQSYKSREEAGKKFFTYLVTLAKNGNKIGHSKSTVTYYENISSICDQYLKDYRDNISAILEILGWAKRLTYYYKNTFTLEDLDSEELDTSSLSFQSERQIEIANILASEEFKIGQIVEARITNVRGNKVTYNILDKLPNTQKEPKISQILEEKQGQMVKVEIIELKEDGSIKKVKYIE
ncbi:hypothetical protein [Merismopedia glauca]|uniref:Uncharacterized protein n=1 Tax=Merismopedia glauca CCAP 1448/3 TaxID=1296344 RepID=A0A2T1BZV0_9CYAN|nr:hypothetical protein [Merismopedia glauca]PSB01549.1 hypothetical protein C7B64_17780 [Merismopedia glauca CCAP 1448/3]